MSSRGLITVLVALVFAVSPLAALAAEKQITDIKQLAGTWQGWVTSQLSGSERVLMTIKEDGSYQASTERDGGTLTVGKYYLQGGKVRYRSSRSEGNRARRSLARKSQCTAHPASHRRVRPAHLSERQRVAGASRQRALRQNQTPQQRNHSSTQCAGSVRTLRL